MKITYQELIDDGRNLLAQEEVEAERLRIKELQDLRSSMASALPDNVWEAIGIDPQKLPGCNIIMSNGRYPVEVKAWLDENNVVIRSQAWGSRGQYRDVRLAVNNQSKRDNNVRLLKMMLAEVHEFLRE